LPWSRRTEIVKHDVRRLDRLITDISDASRLDAELARADTKPVDVARLLGTIISLSNETRKEEQAEIVLQVSPLAKDLDPSWAYRVLGHESRLNQVFRNLFDNARSFTAEGSKIIVRVRRLGPDVEVRVEDHGPGIRPDNLERIFERFYTDRPEVSFGKNSGLGLSISKQIIEAHKGRIWAENRLGPRPAEGQDRIVLGARFIVRLPSLAEGWSPSDQA
jgi:two-component system sensor histidine kinase ChvG